MATNKRLQDLTDYTSVLPYASEIFGVYQPLIGWKSARKIKRIKDAVNSERKALLSRLGRNLTSIAAIDFDQDHRLIAPDLKPAGIAGPRLSSHDSIVLRQIQSGLKEVGEVPPNVPWRQVINDEILTNTLQQDVLAYYNRVSSENCRRIWDLPQDRLESDEECRLRKNRLVDESNRTIQAAVEDEAVIAGVLKLLLERNRTAEIASIFYTHLDAKAEAAFNDALAKADMDFNDPYLTFDPKKGVKDVSLSPIGIVHLYRQYFFELDTFLGTPVGHVWLSPGSTLELIEVSTRKTITEKTIEQTLETIVKSETSTTDQDELSEAVKQDNKDDLKLGATATVNQSWATGNASATASLNMNKTQQVARETAHKRMRQQTEKLSSEIRQNYKSTFKTISEVTETSSKRYEFTNTTNKLINYELRRKMRQVGVQVQDIGSYLCWETFVDEPGEKLALANLVHIAQPADLLPVPDQTEAAYPDNIEKTFTANAPWIATSDPIKGENGLIALTAIDPAQEAPSGFQVVKVPGIIPLKTINVSGEELHEYWTECRWEFGARFIESADHPNGWLAIGIIADQIDWDNNLSFVLGGSLTYTATAAKKAEIDAANNAKKLAGVAATRENDRKTKETFIKAVKERIEFASSITQRTFEDLREEERIIVYRLLIESLMWSQNYMNADNRSLHVLAELINSIFDIDKMLYFVAPEWWKPRTRMYRQPLSLRDLQLSERIVRWSDNTQSLESSDNYLITEKSAPAPLGSSLGWLLQLDGDNLRNAFLNAPWVKAVIPVRPGKEQAAMNWLQNVAVEGAEGLGPDNYYASEDENELEQIRERLHLPDDAQVTLQNALDFLCIQVAVKHDQSNETKKFPDTEIDDDNKVTSTPIEKVFEYGFDPLKGGFRVSPNPNDPNFEVFDQWIEILPTDQVVPVEVKYDPKTGRQILKG